MIPATNVVSFILKKILRAYLSVFMIKQDSINSYGLNLNRVF